MAIGAPIDTEAALRFTLDLLVRKGVLNSIDVDQILQYGEREYALKPEHEKRPEVGQS